MTAEKASNELIDYRNLLMEDPSDTVIDTGTLMAKAMELFLKMEQANGVQTSDSGLHLQRVKRSYLGKGTGLAENDRYKLETTRARGQFWLHPILNHIVVQFEEWCEEEYGTATLMFDKKRAIDIRDKLTELISVMGD